jgi:CheY-like chemotaxis protein
MRQWGRTSVPELPVVLVAEDEHTIQTFLEETLSDAGFEAAIVASGEEAIALLKGDTAYRALVTDVHLTGKLDGWDVARVAREIDPAFPVIYMTGAAADEWASKGVPHSVLLAKPFAPAQLVTAVSELLNAAPPAAPKA